MKRIASKSFGGRSKLLQLMKLPIRTLLHARDFYVRRMVKCGQVSRCPGAHGVGLGLPGSMSAASSASVADDHRSEDFKELVRVNSIKTLRLARSASVGMGRIDEELGLLEDDDDETRKLRFDVGENGGGGRKQGVSFRRSKSYAVTTKTFPF